MFQVYKRNQFKLKTNSFSHVEFRVASCGAAEGIISSLKEILKMESMAPPPLGQARVPH